MTEATAPRLDIPTLPTPEEMRAFFSQHPDFLSQNLALQTPEALAAFIQSALEAQPNWLQHIELPEPVDGVISLPHRQLQAFRKKLSEQSAMVAYLHRTAAQNAALDQKMHRFTCALLAAPRGDRDTLCQLIQTHFSVDESTLTDWRSLDLSAQNALSGWKVSRTPLCGRLTEIQRRALLGSVFPETGSAAVVAVDSALSGELSLLTLGRFAPDGFTPDQGTLFVAQIGELASAYLHTA